MGYFNGSPLEVEKAPVDVICDIISVENIQDKIDNYIMENKENA